MLSSDSKHEANRRIDEELVAVDSLKQVLCTRCSCKDVLIHRERHDPPDFWVTIDGNSFPAEVTSIVSDQEYHAHCKEFSKAIRNTATFIGVLSGTYAFIVFRRPSLPSPRSKDGAKLLNAAITYIDATQKQDVSPKVHLAKDKSGEISIKKVSDEGSSVGVLWTPPAMWEGEIQGQLSMRIQHAVNDKKLKLQNVGIGSQTALLLLYDAFGYAEPKDAGAAMQNVNGYQWFHSVFWAASFFDRENVSFPGEPGRNGCFLFSSNQNWNRVGTVQL